MTKTGSSYRKKIKTGIERPFRYKKTHKTGRLLPIIKKTTDPWFFCLRKKRVRGRRKSGKRDRLNP